MIAPDTEKPEGLDNMTLCLVDMRWAKVKSANTISYNNVILTYKKTYAKFYSEPKAYILKQL